MTENTPLAVVMQFVEQINARDVDALCNLMTEDHIFIDSTGAQSAGREAICEGWKGYYAMFPDYQISISETFEQGDTVALFGKAGGTYAVNGKLLPENYTEGPAAWRAVVRQGQVAVWQVYADNEPVWKIIRANTG